MVELFDCGASLTGNIASGQGGSFKAGKDRLCTGGLKNRTQYGALVGKRCIKKASLLII
jgi:hypothetical protein